MINILKLIVAGGREFQKYYTLEKEIMEKFDLDDLEIVSGGARGADHMGEIFARKHGINVKVFPALWDIYGKSAGYRRNEEMANYADEAIVFWDGKSKGSKHMIQIMKNIGKKVTVVYY